MSFHTIGWQLRSFSFIYPNRQPKEFMLKCLTPDEVVSGRVTDHCSALSLAALETLGAANRRVTLEAHVRRFPPGVTAGLIYGLADVMEMLAGCEVSVRAMNLGAPFYEGEPVLAISGTARDLSLIRPAITGVLTFGTSLVTRAAEFKAAAATKPVFFFGSRKLHPSHLLQYLECAYVGGMEISASSVCHYITPGVPLEDCQEHYANLVAGDVAQSWRVFVDLPQELGAQFIVLDNRNDPISELNQALECLGSKLKGVLLDTDSTRRGDLTAILRELRWHLRVSQREDVKVALTGGVSPDRIQETRNLVDSYGVGLAALQTDQFDFALQVIAVDDRPYSKLGVRPGLKQVWSCSHCHQRAIALDVDGPKECCGSTMEGLLQPVEGPLPGPDVVRASILARMM
jgi:nicotinate phosphoribosyltransferase